MEYEADNAALGSSTMTIVWSDGTTQSSILFSREPEGFNVVGVRQIMSHFGETAEVRLCSPDQSFIVRVIGPRTLQLEGRHRA
jgi:hypothetical protein